MRTIKLVHNPTAGDEEHKEEKLIKQIEKQGFVCRYSSTKKEGWKEIEDDVDVIAVAGGDGTVRKVVKQLLKRNGQQKHLPIGVLALGTANNIAKTFDAYKDTEEVIKSWKEAKVKKVDIGLVTNVPGIDFFLEGFGFGIFEKIVAYFFIIISPQIFDSNFSYYKKANKLIPENNLTHVRLSETGSSGTARAP
ncbi:MAG: hypothetical protein EOO10_16920, partial [Chitinophagaceae bacterium]